MANDTNTNTDRSFKMNVNLFKETVTDYQECLRASTRTRKYRETQKKIDVGFEYHIVFIENEPKQPDWFKIIKDYVDSGDESAKNKTHSLLIIIKAKVSLTEERYRFFALSCGHGHHAINKDNVEPNFGLITALNCVAPLKLKLIDAKSIESQTIQKRIASNLPIPISALGFERESEILRIVSGECADKTLGARISGSDSLQLTTRISFQNLADKCRDLFDEYNKDTYKKEFDFIDYVRYEKDNLILSELTNYLLTALNARVTEPQLSVAYPDQIDYENCAEFCISQGGKRETLTEVSLESIYRFLGSNPIAEETLRDVKLIGFDANGAAITANESLASYLTFESTYNGIKYVFSGKKWYRIEANYLKRVDEQLNSIASPVNLHFLSAWKDFDKEEAYINSCGSDKDLLILDQDEFSFGAGYGPSKVEVADLVHREGMRFICVKRYTNSSKPISHLLPQASVSASLLRELPKYRDFVRSKLNAKWPTNQVLDKDLDSAVFVYAIGIEKRRLDAEGLYGVLPVFSRINLLRNIKNILRFGFKVEVAAIPII